MGSWLVVVGTLRSSSRKRFGSKSCRVAVTAGPRISVSALTRENRILREEREIAC